MVGAISSAPVHTWLMHNIFSGPPFLLLSGTHNCCWWKGDFWGMGHFNVSVYHWTLNPQVWPGMTFRGGEVRFRVCGQGGTKKKLCFSLDFCSSFIINDTFFPFSRFMSRPKLGNFIFLMKKIKICFLLFVLLFLRRPCTCFHKAFTWNIRRQISLLS